MPMIFFSELQLFLVLFFLTADRTQSVIQIIIDLLSPILEALENIDTAQDKLIKFDRDGDDAAWQAKEKILVYIYPCLLGSVLAVRYLMYYFFNLIGSYYRKR